MTKHARKHAPPTAGWDPRIAAQPGSGWDTQSTAQPPAMPPREFAAAQEQVRSSERGQVPGAPRKRRHIFLWFFLAIQVIFIIWLIVGLTSVAQSYPECAGLTGQALELCESEQAGTGLGATVGAGFIILIWAAVDIILAIMYGLYRLARKGWGAEVPPMV
ncbi:hypothetical protein [Streptomyces sp. NPDC015131]|uniref:hypothetical protein n=1 Tax=Streptomyces sp. NPDC015131 TaxID=3364941 RepID=UPI0036FE4CB9